ncbi:hypothetical protein SLEP1_g21645 [Rubroshorea leprosula]|uniref:Subtilisin-like protease fibronectin type-III domain-containing protein n=1 Tax=Rubroshorea leprosula TaxID=152421 RepID=A0AAV5JFV6_9ROSI|nr:hypothetical protein SLEP1_g21645 [Rubroshorea leprosula]
MKCGFHGHKHPLGTATYKVKVVEPEGSTIVVSPETLAFRKTHEKRSYSVAMKYRSDKNGKVSFGELVWIENGKHTVRSPIVISPPSSRKGFSRP